MIHNTNYIVRYKEKKNINGIAIIIISLQMSNQSILAFDTESEYDSDATFLIND